jgi:hypothetical protein
MENPRITRVLIAEKLSGLRNFRLAFQNGTKRKTNPQKLCYASRGGLVMHVNNSTIPN